MPPITLKTPKLTQEQMFDAAYELAKNSPGTDVIRIAIPNLLAVCLVGRNARVHAEHARRKREDAEDKAAQAQGALTNFKARMLAGLKEAYGQGEWLNIHNVIQELAA